MLKKANLDWNARQLCKMVKKGEIKFDNAVQRGLVWDVQRKSLLIHSIQNVHGKERSRNSKEKWKKETSGHTND